MNLTGHRTAELVIRRLILDAAALDACAPPEIGSLVDVGAGAGFPGLPMAILHPERRVVMVESRERRHHFQRMAIRALGLVNAEARLGRAERLTPSPCDAALAQGVASPREVAPLLLPWLRPGGWLMVPVGARGDRMRDIPGVEGERVVAYEVPLGGPRRSFWSGRKIE
jgi:16S rRNA (guanine527-N7)-methyltransferase